MSATIRTWWTGMFALCSGIQEKLVCASLIDVEAVDTDGLRTFGLAVASWCWGAAGCRHMVYIPDPRPHDRGVVVVTSRKPVATTMASFV